MSERHLDERGLTGLLRGGLDAAEARRLAGHMREPCGECERFLSGRQGALEALADLALAAPPPRGGEAGNDVEFARVMRGVRRRRARPLAAAAALAAGLLAVAGATLGVVRHRPAGEPEQGVKGLAPAPVPVRLRALMAPAGPAGAAPELLRVASGAEVPGSAGLLFRVETGAAAELALLRVGPADLEVVFRARAGGPGAVDVSAGGKLAAYSLRGLAGRQRFVAVAGRGALGPDVLEAAGAALRAGAGPDDARLGGVALSELDVVVVP